MKQILLTTIIIMPNQPVITKILVPVGKDKTIEHKIKNLETKSKVIQKIGKDKTIETRIGEPAK